MRRQVARQFQMLLGLCGSGGHMRALCLVHWLPLLCSQAGKT